MRRLRILSTFAGPWGCAPRRMHGVVSSVVSRLSVVSTLTVMLGVADALTTSKTVYFVRHGQVHPAAPFHPLAVVQLERGMRVAG